MTIAVRKVTAAFLATVTLSCWTLVLKAAAADSDTSAFERIFKTSLPEDFLARSPVWSVDERKLAYLVPQQKADQLSLVVIDLPSARRALVLDPLRLARVLHPESHFVSDHPLSLAWAADGRTLIVGGAHAIARLDVRNARSQLLYESTDDLANITVSPDSQWISFVANHNLQLISVHGGTRRSLTTDGSAQCATGQPDWLYSHELGLTTGYWWSPDSQSIAYLQFDDSQVETVRVASAREGEPDVTVPYPVAGAKNPRVTLFTTPVAGGPRTRVADSGDGYLPRVTWLPDSKQIAFEVLNRAQEDLQLSVASDAGRDTHVLIAEHDAYWINLHDDLRFLSDNSGFLWSSERSGYRHLYLYGMHGELLRQVTTGEWQVEGVQVLNEASRTVFFAANERGTLERHLYRVALDGSDFKQITKGAGWHAGDFSRSGRYYVDTSSSIERPPAQMLCQGDGVELTALGRESSLDSAFAALPEPELFKVSAHDGNPLDAMTIKPLHFDPRRKYPVLVFVSGGPGDHVVRNAWGGRIGLWHRSLAAQGFVIFALDNRGSGGRSHLFEEPIHRRFSAIELSDQRDGILYLRRFPWVDPARIGVWGLGYGAHMALHALFQDPQDFRVGFAASPIADWTLYNSAFSERYLHVPQGYSPFFAKSSVLESAKDLRGKLLIAENLQAPNQTKDVDRLLTAIGKRGNQVDVFVAPDLGVDEPDEFRAAAFVRAAEFFRRNLLDLH